ncbi:thioredoxin family protein [Sulfurospirillum sp.]|jgi:thioredoxin 1|uniref:thioredoxin family protein n=1 Tax=Sulfurospirillum sp. TaxID=2053622 RepID=UPI002FDCB754
MKKKIVLALLTLLLVGCGEAKVDDKKPIPSPLSQSKKIANSLDATPYAQISSEIGKKPMLVEFGSTSCASCVEMGKLLYRVKQEYPQSAIYFVEVYNDMPTANIYKIQIIPTQIYLNSKGEEVDRHMGLVTYEQLIAKLQEQKII